MNEMYEMSQSIHIFSVVAMIISLIIMMLIHKSSYEVEIFEKKLAIAMVFYSSFLGAAALTGMIMMAAKHLDFTLANLVMIIGLMALIGLEIKRYKILKMVIRFKRVELDVYKRVAFNYEIIELVLILVIGAFAGMAS